MPIHGYENLKPKQIGFVVASFAAAALLTMAVFSVVQSAGFGLVVAVFTLSFFLTLNEREVAVSEPPKQSNRAQDLIAQMKDYQTPNSTPGQLEEPEHREAEPTHEEIQHQSALSRALIARQRAEAQVAQATGEAPSSYLGAAKSAAEQLSAGVLAAAAAAPAKEESVHIEYDNFPPSQIHASAISDQQFDQSLLEALPTAISNQRRVNTNLYKHREHKCWKCKEMMYLYTWKGHEMWSQVPPPEPKPDSIQYRYYQTIAAKFWANVCPKCDTVQGDHLIFEDMPPALWENID